MHYRTIQVDSTPNACTIELLHPRGSAHISATMVHELACALDACEGQVPVVVLKGGADVFCLGADFDALAADGAAAAVDPQALYALWRRLARSPFVSIAQVRGKAQAGGVGFVAACDIALGHPQAEFTLSELLFDLFPACVLPFLIRRIGTQKAHYMTLTTLPVPARQAVSWGLLDAVDEDVGALLRRHLLRLRHLSVPAIARYKQYAQALDPLPEQAMEGAIAANRGLFGDAGNLRKIRRFVETGRLPWDT
ncbi:enoyl-CoA hydratase/isomerase [Xanthomonas campestris pv. fici]|uniref:enoyl-CoA hydratase/isomerase n=1 Tax=Xanthomonas euvesicatoria TaxID=456327 RepID=UPI00355639C4